jgi:hypothetical protein
VKRPVEPSYDVLLGVDGNAEVLRDYYLALGEYERWAGKRENETSHKLKSKAHADAVKAWSTARSYADGQASARAAFKDWSADVKSAKSLVELARERGWDDGASGAVAGWVGDIAICLDPLAWFDLAARPATPPRGGAMMRLLKGWGLTPAREVVE